MNNKELFEQVISYNYDLELMPQTQLKVKLTDAGYQRMADYANENTLKSPYIEKRNAEHYKGDEDPKGYKSMTFSMFIAYFGSVIIGVKSPYYTDVKIDLIRTKLTEK